MLNKVLKRAPGLFCTWTDSSFTHIAVGSPLTSFTCILWSSSIASQISPLAFPALQLSNSLAVGMEGSLGTGFGMVPSTYSQSSFVLRYASILSANCPQFPLGRQGKVRLFSGDIFDDIYEQATYNQVME